MLRSATLATAFFLSAATSVWAQSTTQAPSAVALESPAIEPMQEVQVGDHWTYELKDEISGEIKATITNVVTDVTASEVNTHTGNTGRPGSNDVTFDRSWNEISSFYWKYAPHDGSGVSLPLAVGKTWSFKGTDVHIAAGYSYKRSGTAKVVAQESVTTRVGTFDTFKIETTSLAQGTNDPTKKYQLQQTSWYAPVINHWVKRTVVNRLNGKVTENNTIELVEYGRR